MIRCGIKSRKSPARSFFLNLESLEQRQVMSGTTTSSLGITAVSATPTFSLPSGFKLVPVAAPANGLTPAITPANTPAASAPFDPAQIRHAYGVDQLSLDGTGQTIAIVDAYDDPSIAADLVAFDKEFGLPTANFQKIYTVGSTLTTTAPTPNSDWAGEISLDVEWSHAIAPGAKILLVEAASATDPDPPRRGELRPELVC